MGIAVISPPSLNVLETIFNECRTIAVVGLSSNPSRPSHAVARYMQEQGYRVIPVNPNEAYVLGVPAYCTLSAVSEPIDLVSVFRRPDQVEPIVLDGIALGVRAIWLQEGIIHEQAAERARRAGLLFVMDRCWLKEHSRLRSSRGLS